MKNLMQVLGFILIVIWGFWVGMPWGSVDHPAAMPTTENIAPTIPSVPEATVPVTPAPIPTDTTTVPAPVTPQNTDSSTATTPTPAPAPAPTPTPAQPVTTPTNTSTSTTTSTTSPADQTVKDDKIIHYENKSFGYSFDVPNSVYYSGFGAQNGAIHTVGISKDVPETLEASTVRVYYYGKKIVPELQGQTTIIDPAGKFEYLLLDGQYSVKIESDDIHGAIAQKVIQTIAVIQ